MAFVGGSLVAAGGHNPLEPAQYAVPILMGPNYANFRAIVETLRMEQAMEIVGSENLAESLIHRMKRRDETALMGARAFNIFEREAGATSRAVDALLHILAQTRGDH